MEGASGALQLPVLEPQSKTHVLADLPLDFRWPTHFPSDIPSLSPLLPPFPLLHSSLLFSLQPHSSCPTILSETRPPLPAPPYLHHLLPHRSRERSLVSSTGDTHRQGKTPFDVRLLKALPNQLVPLAYRRIPFSCRPLFPGVEGSLGRVHRHIVGAVEPRQ